MSDHSAALVDHLVDPLSSGLDLHSLRELVSEDLVSDDSVDDIAGAEALPSSPGIPRLRPILVALAARAAGATEVDAEAQYAAEMLHLALLVHDLTLGTEGGRRRRIARRIIRHSVSWLASNRLTLRALELSRHADPRVLEDLLDTLREIGRSQALCAELQAGRAPTRNDWEEHAGNHTGAVFAFCCRTGAHLANSELPTCSALGRYGRHVGRMWQAAEDISAFQLADRGAYLLARAKTGRPVLPVICASEHDPAIRDAWTALIQTPSIDAANGLADRVVARGGLVASKEVMVREGWWAQRGLRRLPPSRYRKALAGLAHDVARSGRRAA